MDIKGFVKTAILNVFGTALFKAPANSTTSFQVQDQNGDIAFDVDTTDKRIGIGREPVGGTVDWAISVGAFTSGSAIRAIAADFFSVNHSTDLCKFRFGGGDSEILRAYMEFRQTWNGATTDTEFGFFTTKGGIGGAERLTILGSGNVGIGSTAPTSKLHVVGLPVYANNAAAVAGGLTAGAFYRTNGDPDQVCVVH